MSEFNFKVQTFQDFEDRYNNPISRAELLVEAYKKRLAWWEKHLEPKPIEPRKPTIKRLLTLMSLPIEDLTQRQITQLKEQFSE